MNFGSLFNLLVAIAFNPDAEPQKSMVDVPEYLPDSFSDSNINSTKIVIEIEKIDPADDETTGKENERFIDLTQLLQPVMNGVDESTDNKRFLGLTQVPQPQFNEAPSDNIPSKSGFNLDLTTMLDANGKPLTQETTGDQTVMLLLPLPAITSAKVEAIRTSNREKNAKSAMEEALNS